MIKQTPSVLKHQKRFHDSNEWNCIIKKSGSDYHICEIVTGRTLFIIPQGERSIKEHRILTHVLTVCFEIGCFDMFGAGEERTLIDKIYDYVSSEKALLIHKYIRQVESGAMRSKPRRLSPGGGAGEAMPATSA